VDYSRCGGGRGGRGLLARVGGASTHSKASAVAVAPPSELAISPTITPLRRFLRARAGLPLLEPGDRFTPAVGVCDWGRFFPAFADELPGGWSDQG
jgi:hypothetical protein